MRTRRYSISARFHPAYSVLGRALRGRDDDVRRAESRFIAVLAVAGLVLVLLQMPAWTLAPSLMRMPLFLALQALAAAAFFLLCVVGRQPGIEVEVELGSVNVRSGDLVVRIPLDQIRNVSRVDALSYYRHYRPYRESLDFVNRIPASLLLIETTNFPVVLGLGVREQEEFERELSQALASRSVA